MARPFSDHFSSVAASYAAHRPTYPKALFRFVAGLTTRHELAWDCACGNGQAALGLADEFQRVVATDASAEQLGAATRHPRIDYRVARAEASGLAAGSVDLITVAQALHWFDLAAFYAEAHRVLAPKGAIAVWSYARPRVDEPACDAALLHFHDDVVGPWWLPEAESTENGYRDLPFPFIEQKVSPLELTMEWTLAELLGYVRTWSALRRCAADGHAEEIAAFEREFSVLWGDPRNRRRISWRLGIRAGRR